MATSCPTLGAIMGTEGWAVNPGDSYSALKESLKGLKAKPLR